MCLSGNKSSLTHLHHFVYECKYMTVARIKTSHINISCWFYVLVIFIKSFNVA